MKIDDEDKHKQNGIEVMGGREGLFLEKPDIIDKFCRREITDRNPELAALSSVQFGKMFEPIHGGKSEETEDPQRTNQSEQSDDDIPWKDEEDRLANFYITTNENYNKKRLPDFIKLTNCQPGEVAIWRKRSFPRAARIHKKKEDTDSHRYFFSELMLFHGFTDEDDLGCDDEDKCKNLYLEKKDAIQFVKSHLMPFAQGVEEARHYAEQARQNWEQSEDKTGDKLDPEQEQENEECNEGEDQLHPDYSQLNPDDYEFEKDLNHVKRTFRKIQIKSADERLEDARKLDKFQMKALHIAINFAEDVLISRKGKKPYPKAPLLLIHGGAGSGKSTLIKVIYQYVSNILRKEGDDPDCPYVVLGAFTGTAAANIDGQTLHSLFSFNFGAGYMSLSDKVRDEKRNLFRNLKMLIIDEISLVDVDMLYKIDLRLREITQIMQPFGNIAVVVLGDLMQMSPIAGRYIFLEPTNSQFTLTHDIDPLWRKFECIDLEINHRQGEDKEYADLLNRIRTGEETSEDIATLKTRVRPAGHPDIEKAKDAIFIFATNKKVNTMNNKKLKELPGELHTIDAICLHKTIKNFNPPAGPAGEVLKTTFQKVLDVKIGAKVMLTYNIDTSDGLTNGARGTLIGILFDSKGQVSKLIIKFDRDSVGEEKRRSCPNIERKFPGGTAIEKINFSFSISKSKTSVINTANVIQFPVKLAFACTAHKIQGATISKPTKAIINVTDGRGTAAMIYVMLSRVCSLSQIYILDEFDETKMYPDMRALLELEQLDKISLNKNKNIWEKDDHGSLKISSLNCRSLNKHFQDISTDELLLKSDIIALQETWLEDDDATEDLNIPGYNLHLNSTGRGKSKT